MLKRRSENRVLEDVKKAALKHCDGLVKEFVDCTKVRVVCAAAVCSCDSFCAVVSAVSRVSLGLTVHALSRAAG